MFARYLETFWRDRLLTDEVDPDIQFVVTPKAGSPILGYEFARNLNLPFVIHSSEKKFATEPDEFSAHFDCIPPPLEHGRGLIVDDSSTGGTKVLELIDDLRRFGYNTKDCLIVFEPQLKEARRKIREKGVRLHSIITV
jgi:orotate phosphoribosyltransferase